MTEKFNITGMTCSACSARVEKAMKNLSGIERFSVNLLTNSMTVDYTVGELATETIIQAVEKAGYGASLQEKNTSTPSPTQVENPEKQQKYHLMASVLCLIPLMYVSMGHMMGLNLPSFLLGHENAISFALTQFLLTLPICYWNRGYYQRGFTALWRLTPNMDSLIALGSGSALVYGIFALYRIGYGLGTGNIALVEQYHMDLYFESCATILTLISVGKYAEAKSKGKTKEALSKLMDLSPKTALVEVDGVEIQKNTEDLQVGDLILVKSGTAIPVDGEVVFGHSTIDQSAITGESIPVEVGVGDQVITATINQHGFLKVKAKKVGKDTIFAQIITLVEEASASKAPIAKLADQISGIFVPIVLLLSMSTFLFWTALGHPFELALSFAITVLVISCPCALGLATPVAIMVGTGKSAQLGILVKSGEALELAQRVDTIILDKTGTITQGMPQITDIIPLGESAELLLSLAYSLEKQSEHPLAQAVCDYALEKEVLDFPITDFQAIIGRGVRAMDGNDLILSGNEAFFTENGVDFSKHQEKIDKLAQEGKVPLLFAKNQVLWGIIALSDALKEDSAAAILAMKKLGLKVLMVTGDKQKTAEFIAKDLALDEVIAQVLPQDKEKIVADFQNQGKVVAMVGDGINDAPALIRADVGISMANGTDIAIESGDIVLMQGNLHSVVTAIELSKKVIKKIKGNLFWAFFYNALGIPLAMGVFYLDFGIKLSPMFAAMAMSFSSFFVVMNALGLRRFQPTEWAHKVEIPPETQGENSKTKEKSNMLNFKVEGMMCGHCVAHVTKALEAVAEVQGVEVLLESQEAKVTGDKSLENDCKKAIEEAGYTVISCEIQ